MGSGAASFSQTQAREGFFQESTQDIRLGGRGNWAEGKRTNSQQSATAQYLVQAKPSSQNAITDPESRDSLSKKDAHIESQMIKPDDESDDALLLPKIKFVKEGDRTLKMTTQWMDSWENKWMLTLCAF